MKALRRGKRALVKANAAMIQEAIRNAEKVGTVVEAEDFFASGPVEIAAKVVAVCGVKLDLVPVLYVLSSSCLS